jgi:cytidylate kinase
MTVVTISRETGSGGRYIAEQVAQSLGYRLLDKTIIGRIYGRYAGAEFGIEVGYVPDFWTRFEPPTDERRARMVDTLNHVVLALAHQDNVVILGRSSFAILAEFADVLHVRIQAPIQVRIKLVMERRKITTVAQAEALVRESDRVRAGFVEGFYGSQWDSVHSFNVVIDTSKISERLAIEWLVQAVKALPAQPRFSPRTVSTIQVDPILATILAEELNAQVAPQ